MDDLANPIPDDGRSLSDLLDSHELDPRQWRVRQTGGGIVLERIGTAAGIPPGSYTKQTLPPLSEGARAILASIDAVAPFTEAGESDKSGGDDAGVDIEDAGVGIELSDEGLPGIDPDR